MVYIFSSWTEEVSYPADSQQLCLAFRQFCSPLLGFFRIVSGFVSFMYALRKLDSHMIGINLMVSRHQNP